MGDILSKITNNVLNIVTSISLLLLVYNLFVLRGIQPKGYTVSIYEQLPFHFFLTLLFCFLSACIMLLAYRKMSSILILFLVHVMVLITPYMLGYASVGRGDEFSYIGLTGGSNFTDFSSVSPTGPLFVSALALISKLNPDAISYFLPVLFSVLFIAGMFLFYRAFMSREKLVLVTFLSSLIPYFGHFQISTSPYYLSFCLIPLYLFVLRNALAAKNHGMAVCLLFMIPLISFAHPFIFAYLVCFAISLAVSGTMLKPELLRKILSVNIFSQSSSRHTGKKVPVFIFLSFASVSFLLCSKCVPGLADNFLSHFVWNSEALNTGFLQPESKESIFELIHFFNLYYGKYYIPLIFIIINSIIVWQNRKRFCQHFVHRYPRFLVLYITTFFLELAFLFNPFIPYPLDRFANLSFIIFAQIPLLGYSLYVVFLRKGYILGLGSAVMVLCLLWTLGFFTCFSSPSSYGISEAVSENEVIGVKWLSEANNSSLYMPFGEKEVNDAFSKRSNVNVSVFNNSIEREYSYLVVTTFSESMKMNTEKLEEIPANSEFIQKNNPLYKIYDSLNIDIYEYK